MGKFISKATTHSYFCSKCKEDQLRLKQKEDFWCEGLYSHLLSNMHSGNTPKEEAHDYDQLKKEIEKHTLGKQKSRKGGEMEEERLFDDSQNYLSFIAFCLAERLSFSQINNIGIFLKTMYQKEALDFLDKASFDEELISLTTSQCFQEHFRGKILEDLACNKFSFSIDCSSMVGESLCAVKVKYLKEVKENNGKNKKDQPFEIQNKLVGLYSLKDSSDGKTMLKAVQEKLLINQEIINNLTGLTHDNVGALKSEEVGLVGLLKQTIGDHIYNVPDPCHCLALSVKHSLDQLPKEMLKFIDDIHHYFSFPQRRAALRIFQENHKFEILVPREYASTRWLSLGQSLERILAIWNSVKSYMKSKVNEKKKRKKKNKDFKKLENLNEFLQDEIFELKIKLLHHIISKINSLSQSLQNQSFSLGALKSQMKICFESIFRLLCKREKFDKIAFEEIIKKDWENEATQEDWLMNDEEFILNLQNFVDSIFSKINTVSEEKKLDFSQSFKKYIPSLLNYLIQYLPFTDDTVSVADFSELKDGITVLEDKLTAFNKRFGVVSDSELKSKTFQDLLLLRDRGFDSYRRDEKDTTFDVWSRIDKSGRYPSLAKFGRFVQVLPASSSDIEQEFSIIKLFKTEQRNRLSEKSLEGLLFVHQEVKGKKHFTFPQNIITRFHEVKTELNNRKNGNPNATLPLVRNLSVWLAEESIAPQTGDSEERLWNNQVLKKIKLNDSKEINNEAIDSPELIEEEGGKKKVRMQKDNPSQESMNE